MNASRGQGNPVISAATGAEILDPKPVAPADLAKGSVRSWSHRQKFMGEGFSHTGDTAGFKTIMRGYLSGRGIVVLTNGDNGMAVAAPIIRGVEHVYSWKTYVALSDIR
jgi:hypothetical protein